MPEENPYAAPDADVRVDDYAAGTLAGRGRRLAAAFVDGLTISMLAMPLLLLSGLWDRAMADQSTVVDMLASAGIGIASFLLLNAYLLAKSGQTVGKRLLNMQIVSIDDDSILGLGEVIVLRYVPQWVVSQIPVVGGILVLVNVLFIFGEKRRCVHDFIAGTKVVMARDTS